MIKGHNRMSQRQEFDARRPDAEDFDATDAARRAARQAGMSLSSWMSQVVSDKAAKLGIYEDDMDEDERMDAIVEKLTRLNLRNGRSMARMADREPAAHTAAPRRALSRAAAPEFSRVLERLESMESRLAAQIPDNELVLQNALERIEQRIDKLDSGARHPRPAQAVTNSRGDTPNSAFATIEAKLEALNASLDRSSNLQSNRHSEPAFTATRRFEAPRKATPAAVTPSHEDTSARRFTEHETKAFDGLHAEIAKLAAQMHELRRPQPVAEIANLQQDLANMAKVLADLAPRHAIASLEHRIDDLIDTMRHNNSEALHNGLLGPINDLTSELRQMVSEADPRGHISTLEHEVRHLSRKVADMETAGFDHVAFADLQGQTAEMRQLLQKTLARPQSFEALERQIAFLTDKIEHMSAPGASHSSAAEIAAAIDDIRTMVDRKLGANPLGAVERQIAFLTDKIDHLGTRQGGEPSRGGNSDEIVAAIDEMRSLLDTKPGSQHIQALEHQLHALSSRIDMALAQEPAVAPAAPVSKLDMSALESMLNALAAKIDDARQPSADTHAFAALEAQMNRISAQFDSAETSSMHFRSLQNSITDLFAHLEQTREVALRAAETAVAHTDAKTSQVEEKTLPQVNALSQDINSLLKAQEAADRRATQTMTAVHATLERIVGRLASLEDEVTDTRRRPEPSTFAPVSAPISAPVSVPIFAKVPQNAAASQPKSAPDTTLQSAIATAMAEASAPQDVELIEPASSRVTTPMLHDSTPDFAANREDWGSEDVAPENFLLEPGKGFSPLRKGQRQEAGFRPDHDDIKVPAVAVEDGPTTKSDFIAAARRAAQAAAVASQNQIEDAKLKPGKISAKMSDIGTPASLIEKARRYAEDRKRPLLLGLAGVMVAFLGVQVYGAFGGDAEPVAQKAPQVAPAKPQASVALPAPAPVAAPVEIKPVQPPVAVAPVAPPPPQITPPPMQGASGTRPAPPLPSAVPPSVRQGNPLGLPPGPKAAIQAQKSLFSLNLNQPITTSGFGQPGPAPATHGFSTVKAPAITAAAKKIDMTPLGATAPQPEAVLPSDTVPPPSAAVPPAPKLDAPAQQVNQPAQDTNQPRALEQAPVGAAAATAAVAAPAKLPNPPVTVPALTGQTPPVDAAFQPASSGLKAAANAGNPAAQFELASKFADGRGETRDFKAASALFEKAAAQNLAPAQYRLGALYEKGLGVPRDLSMAKALYQKAADQGNPRAMHNLAVLTAEGSDGHPDYAGALNWFKKAAEYGVRDSQFNLGILCARGLGQAADLPQAYLWFAVAASQGDEDAAKKRDEVALRLDALALETAKSNFAAFKAKTAESSAVEVQIPQGGWDATAPKVENRKLPAPVSKAKIS